TRSAKTTQPFLNQKLHTCTLALWAITDSEAYWLLMILRRLVYGEAPAGATRREPWRGPCLPGRLPAVRRGRHPPAGRPILPPLCGRLPRSAPWHVATPQGKSRHAVPCVGRPHHLRPDL